MISQLNQLYCFKAITDYQINWILHNIPDFNYLSLMKLYPELTKDEALGLLNSWMKYEQMNSINLFNKTSFNSDSNADTVIKLRQLSDKLAKDIEQIILKERINLEKNTQVISEKDNVKLLKNPNGYEIEIAIGKKHWFRNNKFVMGIDDAKNLANNINDVISSIG